MKSCISILLLLSTVLAISESAATILLSPNSTDNNNSLRYYNKYRSEQKQTKDSKRKQNDKSKAPAATFHDRQKLRDQAYELKQKILVARRDNEQSRFQAAHHVASVKRTMNNFVRDNKNAGYKHKQVDQGLKLKINHEAKFGSIYNRRAQENEAASGAANDTKKRDRFNNLGKWDHEQSVEYRDKAAGHLKSLVKDEDTEKSRNRWEEHKLRDMNKDLKKAENVEQEIIAKGKKRVVNLGTRLANVNHRISEGREVQGHSHPKKSVQANQNSGDQVKAKTSQLPIKKNLNQDVDSVSTKTQVSRR